MMKGDIHSKTEVNFSRPELYLALRRFYIPVLVFLIGLILSFWLYSLVRNWRIERTKLQFEWMAHDRVESIRAAIGEYFSAMHSVGQYYIANDEISAEKFQTFVSYALSHYKGIAAFEWIPRVPHSQRAEFENVGKSQYSYEGFQFTELNAETQNLVSAAQRPEYFPVYYVAPLVANKTALGFDLATEPMRMSALTRSRDTGKLAATSPISLVQDNISEPAFLVFLPIYYSELFKKTVDEARRQLRGFVLGVFKIRNVVETALQKLRPHQVNIKVYDQSAEKEHCILDLHHPSLYENGKVNKKDTSLDMSNDLFLRSEVTVADRQWVIDCFPAPMFFEGITVWEEWTVFFGGLVLSLGLSTLLLIILDRNRRIEQLVAQRTVALKETNEALSSRIEEKRLTEQALRRSQQELLDFFENTVGGLCRVGPGPNFCILDVNLEELRILGYMREEYIGHKITDFHVDRDKIDEILARLSEDETIRDYNARLRCKDGSIKEVKINASAVLENGMLVHARFFTRDITERKRAEAAVRERETRFHQFAENMPQVIWMTTAKRHQVIYINSAYETIFGRSRKDLEISGGYWLESIHPEDRKKLHIHKPIEQLSEYVEEFRIVRPDHGVRWLRNYAVPIRNDNGEIYMLAGIAEDISERKLAEELKQKMESELRMQRILSMRSDRLRSLGEMAAGMAHELNQPLVGVRGLAEHALLALDRKWNLTPQKLRSKLSCIIEQSDRMSHIINHIRIFSREAGRADTRSIQVNDVIKSAIEMVRGQFQNRNLEFICNLQENLPCIAANPFSVEEVLLNLFSNARDAVEELRNAGLGSPALSRIKVNTTLETIQSTPKVLIEVIDFGVGIPDDLRSKIFEPFFTTKGPDRGTGLGLSVSKWIVSQFGGTLEIHSRCGVETTVKIRFPPLPSIINHNERANRGAYQGIRNVYSNCR